MSEQTTPPPTDIPKEARTWAMLCHISALAGHLIPFGNVLAPLIIWLIKKDEHEFISDQGKEAINFQITVTLAMLICFALMLVLIGFFLAIAVYITSLVLLIIATIKANEGVRYRYPFTLRLVS